MYTLYVAENAQVDKASSMQKPHKNFLCGTMHVLTEGDIPCSKRSNQGQHVVRGTNQNVFCSALKYEKNSR